MSYKPEQEFDPLLDRALKSLPDLEAPRVLVPRVMKAIAERREARWYSLPWHSWPVSLQAFSLMFLLGSFGAFCYAAWRLSYAAGQTETMAELRDLLSGASLLWRTLNTVASSFVIVVKQLGAGVLALIAFALFAAYATCLGVGTMFWRMAWNRD